MALIVSVGGHDPKNPQEPLPGMKRGPAPTAPGAVRKPKPAPRPKPQHSNLEEEKCYNCDEMVVPVEGRCPYCTGRV